MLRTAYVMLAVRGRNVSPRWMALLFSLLGTGVAAAGQKEWQEGSYIWNVVTLQSHNVRLVVLSTALLGASSGMVGTFLLLRRRSLLGDALSHATYPGVALAFLVMLLVGGEGKWLPGLLLGGAITGVTGVLLVLAIRNTTRIRDDAAMGIVLGVFFGAGVALMKLVSDLPGADAAGLNSFIYGSAASMIFSDFALILVITLLAAVFSLLLLKELTLLCFDENFAASQGWPTLFIDLAMLALVTAVTVVGLQAVGLVLIIALLIIPATAARFWTHNLRRMLWTAALFGAVSGWVGASLSALFSDLPAGAVIVLVAALLFLVSMLLGPARGIAPRFLRQSRLQRKVGRQHLLRAFYEILEGQQLEAGTPVRNLPISHDALLAHRSWPLQEVNRLLRTARGEDHLEEAGVGQVRLSEAGFGEAARVTRNHRLWELYLIRYADIAPSHVDRDADLVEHVLDAEVVHQLESELQDRTPGAEVPPSPHYIDSPGEGSIRRKASS